MDNEFKTQDIKLATYLKINGVKFLRVEPLDQYNSTFVFIKPNIDILTKWFNDSANIQITIDSYRSLLRDARVLQNKIAENL